MDSAALLRSFEDGLRTQVQGSGGELHVASDPDHVLEILTGAAPRKFRVILNWGGDEAVDLVTTPGIRTFKLMTTVQAARGLAIDAGDTHRERPVSGREPLLVLAARVDQWIRGFSGNHPDLHDAMRKVSSNWLIIDNAPTRQITHEHRCVVADDPPLNTPCTFAI